MGVVAVVVVGVAVVVLVVVGYYYFPSNRPLAHLVFCAARTFFFCLQVAAQLSAQSSSYEPSNRRLFSGISSSRVRSARRGSTCALGRSSR